MRPGFPPCNVIVSTMNFTRPMQTNATGRAAAGTAIRMAKLPRYVVDRRWQMDLDPAGEAAISIWLIVADGKRLRPREIYHNRAAVRAALTAAGLSLWPFVFYRTFSEQRSFDRSRRRA